MSLKSDLLTVRDAALADLVAAHDCYAFTARAWRRLEELAVDVQDALSFTNDATGTTVGQADLFARAQGYVADELAAATLGQFVSVFEAFLSDVLRLWLIAHPQSLSRRQLSGEDILALPDKPAIVDALVGKELAAVLYDRPANWFRYLNDRVATGVPSDAEVRQFAEIKATRDVMVHGQGMVNATYADKAGPLARGQIGEPLDIPAPYHRASWLLLCKLAADVGTAMAGKAG